MRTTLLVAALLAGCGGLPTVPENAKDALVTCVYGTGVYGHGYVLQMGANRGDNGSKGHATVKCGEASVTFTDSNK